MTKIQKVSQISFFTWFIVACQADKLDYINSIAPKDLQLLLKQQDVMLIDVHTPMQAHIKGTDLVVPYNDIEKFQDQLPKDKNTPIYLYCEGGPMGQTAAKTLHKLGYQHLYNLTGGTNAWRTQGLPLE